MTTVRQAVRALLRTPGLALVAVLSLALGIGANAAIFSMFEQLLLRPVPALEPERLVNLSAPGPKTGGVSCNQAGECADVLSYPMYRDLEREHPGLAGLAGHRLFTANLAQEERTVNGEGVLVSGTYFPVLGLRPALGRLLQPADDRVPGEHAVAVLSHRFWTSSLGGDARVLNTGIVVNGVPLTVVGVAPKGFDGTTLGGKPDVFVPLSMRAEIEPYFSPGFDNRSAYWVYAFGRLAPGVGVERAGAELNRLYSGIINERELELQHGLSDVEMEEFRAKQLVLTPGDRGQSTIDEESRTPLTLLLAITILVLLIACANIANLLLARGARRSGEMAIRGSLGAGRGRLVWQLLAEALVLAAVGGIASLVVAWGTLGFVASLLPAQARWMLQADLHPSIFLFTAVVTVATALLFGLYPALQAARTDLVTVLRSESPGSGTGRAASRFRTALVTAQIALSMTLLVASGLFIRSLEKVARVDLGIETEGVVTFSVAPLLNGYEPGRSRILFQRLEEELAALPGVSGVSAAMIPVLTNSSNNSSVAVEGFDWEPGVEADARYNVVGPGFFSTLGIPLISGREFRASDAGEEFTVAVVNESFTRKYGLDPRGAVGKRMGTSHGGALDLEIIGVIQDAAYTAVRDEIAPQFFLPVRQDDDIGYLSFYVRTESDPASVLHAIPELLQRLDPNLPVEDLTTLPQTVRANIFLDRMLSILAAAFAALATLLAAIGLYGVLSYTVAQRTREFGLRMALGAEAPRVRAMVLRQVGWMLVIGGVIGMLAALALGRAAGSFLYQVQGHDPVAFGAAVVLLALVALAAGYVPAFRASRVDPMRALRYD